MRFGLGSLSILLLAGLPQVMSSAYCPSMEKLELPSEYSLTDPPLEPQPVWLSFLISEVTSISDLTNTLHMQGQMYLRWNESRLTLNGLWLDKPRVHLKTECVSALWTPDVWIERLVQFNTHNVMGNLDRLTITPPYQLEYWQSVSLTILCPMNLDHYPFDEQQCLIRFSSNGLRVTEQRFVGGIELMASAFKSPAASEYELGIEQHLNFTYHTLSCASAQDCWPQIAATLHLSRHFRSHCLQAFLPTACAVVLSWISFLIPPYIVPGRMVLLVTLLLVVLDIYATQYQAAPTSRGMNVQDVWFLSCVLFILSAIFEYAFCLYVKRAITRKRWREESRKRKKKEKETKEEQQHDDPVFVINLRKACVQRAMSKDAADSTASQYGDINDCNLEGEHFLADVDFWALRVFPVAFTLFIVTFVTLVLN